MLATQKYIPGKEKKYNGRVYHLFIDFEKAYDSVRKEVSYNIFTEFNLRTKVFRLIKMHYLKETYCKFRI